MSALLHVCAPPVDNQQRCARCGALIMDRRVRPNYRPPKRGFFRTKTKVVVVGTDACTVAKYPWLPSACEVPEKIRAVTVNDVDTVLLYISERTPAVVAAILTWTPAELCAVYEWASAVEQRDIEPPPKPAFMPEANASVVSINGRAR